MTAENSKEQNGRSYNNTLFTSRFLLLIQIKVFSIQTVQKPKKSLFLTTFKLQVVFI